MTSPDDELAAMLKRFRLCTREQLAQAMLTLLQEQRRHLDELGRRLERQKPTQLKPPPQPNR
jgi:hypothetical protein